MAYYETDKIDGTPDTVINKEAFEYIPEAEF